MKIDSEVLLGHPGMVVDTDSIRWWDSPHDDEEIDAEIRATIVDNIRRAFASQDVDIEFVGSERSAPNEWLPTSTKPYTIINGEDQPSS
jgi:hypothetical protein